MSFVGSVTALALLTVAAGGLYGGAVRLRDRKSLSPDRASGMLSLGLTLIYMACAIVALLAFAGLLLLPGGL